ncbi:MAG: hypothetical protein M1820_008095 [Bogoriella megaspora]|nr:MAG: hypothetical protein M1820_008095 [Bogoriella megaspora]
MAENYQMLEELGSGSFGVVYKAIEKNTGEIVAIKHIDLEGSDDDIREIQQEISLLSTCASPFVTHYRTSFIRGVKLWIVMEYLGGGSCLDLLKPGPMSEAQIAVICRELVLGLDYLHQTGKIHRDIKAANVLLSQSGKVKIADFGVAAQLTNIKSQRITFVGTPFWMAPEVIQEAGYDFKADIWSLGITMMELANGEPPHADTHPMKVLFHIPKAPAPRLEGGPWSRDFRDFVAQCLVKDPDRRPTAKELLGHRFVKKVGKIDILKDLIARKQAFDDGGQDLMHPRYYEETLKSLPKKADEDEWVFDTVRPITAKHETQKRRRVSRIPSSSSNAGNADDIGAVMEKLELNAAPLNMNSPSPIKRKPAPGVENQISRKASSATSTTRRLSATAISQPLTGPSETPTMRRMSAPKQPLALDMSFGNSTSTVRQFRRVSQIHSPVEDEARKGTEGIHSERVEISVSSKRFSRASTMVEVQEIENQQEHPKTHTVEPKQKESLPVQDPPPSPSKLGLLGNRAYKRTIAPALQDVVALVKEKAKKSHSAQIHGQLEILLRFEEAWEDLNSADPESQLLLLKAILDRIQGEKKLATTLGLIPKQPATPAPSDTDRRRGYESRYSEVFSDEASLMASAVTARTSFTPGSSLQGNDNTPLPRSNTPSPVKLPVLPTQQAPMGPPKTPSKSPSKPQVSGAPNERSNRHTESTNSPSPSKKRGARLSTSSNRSESPAKLVLAQNNPHLQHHRHQSAVVPSTPHPAQLSPRKVRHSNVSTAGDDKSAIQVDAAEIPSTPQKTPKKQKEPSKERTSPTKQSSGGESLETGHANANNIRVENTGSGSPFKVPHSPLKSQNIVDNDEGGVKLERKKSQTGMRVDDGMQEKFPGQVVPGLDHVKALGDALYGRWAEGLKERWSVV